MLGHSSKHPRTPPEGLWPRIESVVPEVVFLQLVSAVGQGAANIRVGYDALAFLRTQYLERIAERLDQPAWPAQRPVAIEWARGVGRSAAAAAIARGAYEVGVEDVEDALFKVQKALAPDGNCPFT